MVKSHTLKIAVHLIRMVGYQPGEKIRSGGTRSEQEYMRLFAQGLGHGSELGPVALGPRT